LFLPGTWLRSSMDRIEVS